MIRSLAEIEAARANLEVTRCFTVCAQKCANCLFDKARIVDGARAAAIIRACRDSETYFACHEFQALDDDTADQYTPTQVCCRAYFDTVGADSKQIRMAHAFGIVKFVNRDGIEVPNGD